MTPYDIILVPFPFSDLATVKKRPCLILAVLHPRGLPAHYVVSMMTSSTSRIAFPYDVVLEEWKKARLPKKTIVRLSKLVTVDASLIRKRLGRISAKDRAHIQAAFRQMFSSILV